MKGKLIIIEAGSDASGKATQTKRLFTRMKGDKYNIRKVEYPNYKSNSSALVKMYLNGEFGYRPDDVNAYAASTFYAVDRYASYMKEWKRYYENGGIVLADRYTTSNMVHQASKLDDEAERNEYLDWLWDLEFVKLGLPVPDMVIFLDVPPLISNNLMSNRNNKITGGSKKDIHENDREYLRKTYLNACRIAEKYEWKRIECIANNFLRNIDDIHDEIYDYVVKNLPL
ncbi:MAG: thymidylate kinase [Clostridia bacterium BRH_c25]|nr:MAG: thymidylate kinase [Clostridia bacterium BRH_c25]